MLISPDFRQFIFKMLEESKKKMVCTQKIFFKTHDFWGTSPRISDREARPPVPPLPGGGAHAPREILVSLLTVFIAARVVPIW